MRRSANKNLIATIEDISGKQLLVEEKILDTQEIVISYQNPSDSGWNWKECVSLGTEELVNSFIRSELDTDKIQRIVSRIQELNDSGYSVEKPIAAQFKIVTEFAVRAEKISIDSNGIRYLFLGVVSLGDPVRVAEELKIILENA